MARLMNRLTARQVTTIRTPGMHADGGGLYLSVQPSLSKQWVYIFSWNKQRREMGLGSAATVTLSDAREAAADARKLVASGINPIEERKEKQAGRVEPDVPTFGDVADEVLEGLETELSNPKHRAQWKTSLKTTAKKLCPMAVHTITTDDVLGVLRPIWTRTPESASRTRARIERVFSAAKAKGLREGQNPAAWKDHLDSLLPKRKKTQKKHHPALPYLEIADFMELLGQREAVAARALEFTILTAARTSEALCALWSEIDLVEGVWTVPAERMKARVVHEVPLSPAAIAVLRQVRPLLGSANDGFVFPGHKRGKPTSRMSMLMLMRRMEMQRFTVHGFRSTFRDWAGDCTNFARELIESALAHTIKNKAERAYRRSTAFEKRKKLMVAWAGYCQRASTSTNQRMAA